VRFEIFTAVIITTSIMWKKVPVAYFKVLSQQLPRGTEENSVNLCQDNRSSRPDLSPGPQR
jgi:hypothetical protein